jgi:hypothetical protein
MPAMTSWDPVKADDRTFTMKVAAPSLSRDR